MIRSADSLASSTSSLQIGESSSPADNDDTSSASTSSATPQSFREQPHEISSSKSALEQLLSVDVEVSAGRWEVEGKYLRWHVSKAEAIADDAGNPADGVFRHSIKVKRKGGPVSSRCRAARGTSYLLWPSLELFVINPLSTASSHSHSFVLIATSV